MRSFTHEFSKRGVGKRAIGCLATVWVGHQVLRLLREVFDWPITPLGILIGTVAASFPVFVLFAWYRDTSSNSHEAM